MDVLSDVLNAVHISGAMLFRGEFGAPWALYAPPSCDIAPMLVPNARRMLMFHIIAAGGCWAENGGVALELGAGDLLVLPYGDALTLGDRTGRRPTSILGLLPPPPWPQPPVVQHGGDGAATTVLCGFLHVDEIAVHPLLAGMPPMLRIRAQETLPRLQAVIAYAIDEARAARPGGAGMLGRLAEVMYVEILRQFTDGQSEQGLKALSSLNDPIVGRVLALIHSEPSRDWTVESLARTVGTSRSVLAERFTERIGRPPMAYLGQWRIQLAAHRLRETRESIGTIAAAVGYQSEPAFHKAFKREIGEPPAAWRRRNAMATSA